MKNSLRNLHQDQQGAVMMMGLGMSCFLIGMLWYVIGLGDAMIIRDTSQEAADHAAFTAAVLHAKGMNFISAMNLILLAVIAVHMVFCLVVAVAGAVCAISCALVVTGCAGCGFFTGAMNWHSKYAKFMKPAGNTIHNIEVAAAYGYPFIGMAKSVTVGADYGGRLKRPMTTPSFSTSMIPVSKVEVTKPTSAEANEAKAAKDAAVCGTEVASDQEFTRSGGATIKGDKLGLPVQSDTFKSVCLRISNVIVRSIQDLVRPLIPDIPVLKDKILQALEDLARDQIGRGVTFTMCNDLSFSEITDPFQCNKDVKDAGGIGGLNGKIDGANSNAEPGTGTIGNVKTDSENPFPGFDKWWGEKGPLVSWSASSNGDVWHQVWALSADGALGGKYADPSVNKVALASGPNHGASALPPPPTPTFTAQAEFYFDCKSGWSDPECNGDQTAAYSIRWRARLRRVNALQFGTMLGDVAARGVQNLIGDLTSMIIKEAAGNTLDNPLGGVARGRIADLVNQFTAPLTGQLTQGIQDAAQTLNPQAQGVYH